MNNNQNELNLIEATINDAKIVIRFSHEESHGIREAVINALTSSYEQRVYAHLNRLCLSLEPERAS